MSLLGIQKWEIVSKFFYSVFLIHGKLDHYLEYLSRPFTASLTEVAQAEQNSQSKPGSDGVDDRQEGKLEKYHEETVCC